VTQRGLLDPVDRDLLAADLDHGDPLPEALLELRDPGDVDLVDLEPQLRRERLELVARAVAQVAVSGRVEGDRPQGYSPRIVLASATRETARP
jgi:hypothetical protein